MEITEFDHRSIKSFLLRSFLPLLILSVAAITIWSVGSAWYGARRGGEQWAAAFATHFDSHLYEIRQEALLAKDSIVHAIEHNQTPRLPEEYAIIRLNDFSSIQTIFGNFNIQSNTDQVIGDLKKIEKAGLYEIDGNLVFAVPMEAKEDSTQRLVLLKRLDHIFADRLSSAMGTEVSFYVLHPEPKISATSWKNIKDERVIPKVAPEIWETLNNLRDTETLRDSAEYQIPDYRGLYQEGDGIRSFHKGESVFGAYHAFRPILDENKKRIGYFSVIVPEDVLLVGAKKGVWALSIIGVLVAILGAWLINRAANRIAKPISKYAEEINEVARTLYLKSAKYGGEISMPAPPKTRSELASLAMSIELLKEQVTRAERIEEVIEDERSRTQFASKMAALGEMSASVAHEINNPVSVIHALSDELQEKAQKGPVPPEEIKRLSIIIKDTAARVASIIRALLRLSRDAKEDPMEWHSLKSILDDGVILVQDQITKENISFSVLGLNQDIRVLCRGTQISQVILNLLNNAIDAVENSANKIVKVQVEKEDTKIQISVTDSGSGISEKLKDKIMEPFVTSKPPGKGTGLGLSISKHIIEEHEGKLFLDKESKETRFVIELPIGQDLLPITSLEEATSIRST